MTGDASDVNILPHFQTFDTVTRKSAWVTSSGSRTGKLRHYDAEEGAAFGFMAGLIPCPLTLFVMTFAIVRGVPEAGIAFAVTMMAGV
ncbi:MAG: hypothetical protein E5Y56_33685, partial [Mesorhizobium sp.]